MKKSLLLALLLFSLNFVWADDLNEAKRFLKLAITQIDADNIDEANASYNRAKSLIGNPKNWEARYWDAVSDEVLGKIHLKMGNVSLAKVSYEIAVNKYKKLINMKDGSPDAIQEILTKIDNINDSIERMLDNAKIISLDNSKQSSTPILPKDVEKFSCINCKLKEFPYWLTNYKNLTTIILEKNNIKSVQVPKMLQLKYLDLSNNKVKNIDGDFADIPNLEYLYLNGMNLKKLPTSIIKLPKLKILDIRGNNIPFSEIKNLIQSMPNTLIIHDNYVLETQKGEEEEEQP